MNFSPDRPIQHRKEDRLKRGDFVNSIVASIKGWTGSESLVIGISGPWGSGKSSIKNMIKEDLGLSKSQAQVVEFNPWQWAGQGQLAEAFFSELEIALGKNSSADSTKTAAKLNLYSARLRLGRLLSHTAFHLVTRLMSLVVGLGLAYSFLTRHFGWSLVLLVLSGLLLIAEKLFSLASDWVSKLHDIEEAKAALYETSMEDIKEDLRKDLKKLNAPILIIIDDIDRLTAPQIGYLFQLVKANADFPNLIYLLLMERGVVEKSLNEITANNGKNYLDKIVQVNLTLPTIARSALLQILDEEILGLLSGDSSGEYEEHRLSAALSLISTNFKTLRSVHRFTNALAFDLSALRGDKSLSVNKIDLICLSVIKLFHEPAYALLHKAKRLLVREHNSGEGNDDVIRLRAAIVDTCSEDEKHSLLNLLNFLFPQFPWDDRILHGSVPDDEALTSLRICHQKNFDRYFVGYIEADDVSPAEFGDLVRRLTSRENTRDILRVFHERGCLLSVLERLQAFQNLVPAHFSPLLTALFDVSDEVIMEYRVDIDYTIGRRLSSLSSHILQRIDDLDLRLHLLSSSIEATTGLYLPTMKVSWEEPDSQRPAVGGLAEDELGRLRELCLLKLRAWAADGKLIIHAQLGHLLLVWVRWAPDECKGWVAAQIGNKEGQVKISSSVLGCTIDTEGVHFRVAVDMLEKFVDTRLLRDKLASLDTDQLTEEERQSVTLFNSAMTQREEHGDRSAIMQS